MNELTPERERAIRHVLQHCGSVRTGESVLILCNPETRDLAEAFRKSAESCTDSGRLVEMPFSASHGQEPSGEAREAMLGAALTISLCVYSLAHSAARVEAARNGGRFLSLPLYSWKLLDDPALVIDYRARRPDVDRVVGALTAGARARVTGPAGTDVELRLEHRQGNAAPGYVERAGDMGSPPDVEANIAPIEDGTRGVIVADGSITTPEIGLLESPLRLEVEGGRVRRVSGARADYAETLERLLGGADSARRVVGELGVGLNPVARLTGCMLTDEGCMGCIHFGLGSNATIGGCNNAGYHLDVIVRSARLEVDGRTVLNGGRVMV
ncbi:MAG: aminopeptidase [Kiritimatiellae bacterium]|nr:aminopeptidase [Kiritimatiellia bacterium]